MQGALAVIETMVNLDKIYQDIAPATVASSSSRLCNAVSGLFSHTHQLLEFSRILFHKVGDGGGQRRLFFWYLYFLHFAVKPVKQKRPCL